MGYERNDRGYGRDANRFDAARGYQSDEHRHDPRDRGFLDRAGDEVRSWFGDEEAERRRRYDERFDQSYDRERGNDRFAGARSGGQADYPRYDRSNQAGYGQSGYSRGGYPATDWNDASNGSPDRGGRAGGNWREDEYRALYGSGNRGARYNDRNDRDRNDRDRNDRDRGGRQDDPHGYHSWREQQVSGFDRDYDEYRRENQSRFASEFAAWRENRQTQRTSLRQVREHQEVVGSDGAHVGKVDHIRGDRILLTKTDKDAGGHHHSIPSSWIQTVDDKVHLARTAEQAQQAWRDEETNRGLFGNSDRDGNDDRGPADLNRSFSGTY